MTFSVWRAAGEPDTRRRLPPEPRPSPLASCFLCASAASLFLGLTPSHYKCLRAGTDLLGLELTGAFGN